MAGIATWDTSPKVDNPNQYLTDGFINEKEMTEYIDRFACHFAKDVLEIGYKSHKKEYFLGDKIDVCRNGGNKPHVDFLFESKDNNLILVECKNPTNTYAELSNAIGQLLSYYCVAKSNGVKIDRLCLITSRYNDKIRVVINEFKLPIEIYLLSKNNILKVSTQ